MITLDQLSRAVFRRARYRMNAAFMPLELCWSSMNAATMSFGQAGRGAGRYQRSPESADIARVPAIMTGAAGLTGGTKRSLRAYASPNLWRFNSGGRVDSGHDAV